MERIFADSNYFVALYNPEDSLRRKAVEITQSLQRENPRLVISSLVFSEIVTILSQRVGRKAAVSAGGEILSNSSIEILYADESLHMDSWEVFKQIPQKNMSFVDCSIIAMMRADNISTLLTFDRKDFAGLQKSHRFSFYPWGK